MTDATQLQLLITADYENVPTSTTDEKVNRTDGACKCPGYRKVQAQLHALVPDSTFPEIHQPAPVKPPAAIEKCGCGGGRVGVGVGVETCCTQLCVNDSTTQTKETRLITAAELEAICKGRRAKGFPRDSEGNSICVSSCRCRKSRRKKKKQKKQKCCKKSIPNISCPAVCNPPVTPCGPCCCKCGKQKRKNRSACRTKQHECCQHCKRSRCVIM